jgi:hypothetical protein
MSAGAAAGGHPPAGHRSETCVLDCWYRFIDEKKAAKINAAYQNIL